MIEKFAVWLMVVFFVVLCVAIRKYKDWQLLVLAGVMLACVGVASAQNCDTIVADDAGMLSQTPRDRQVLIDAQDLINQGADVKIRTLVSSGGNLDSAINFMEARCPSWQGANGARKSTLLVIAVSKDRKFGIYYGGAWHKAFDDHWNRIKTDYMLPRLKSGDITGAFIAAEEQLTRRIIASKDESLKPVVSSTTTVNQAADSSWMKGVLTLFILLLAGGIFGWIFIESRRRRKLDIEATQKAQQQAIAARNQAVDALNSLNDDIAFMAAEGKPVSAQAKVYIDDASEAYKRIANLNQDPSNEGMSKAKYEVLSQQYGRVWYTIDKAKAALRGTSVTSAPFAVPPPEPTAPGPSQLPGPAPAQPTTVVEKHYHTTYVENEPVFPVYPVYTPPVVVVEREPVREPEYEAPRYHHHNTDEDSSGGSSSWGSSSSSDSDSGGSSSYDSGSDSGGGGSSDF